MSGTIKETVLSMTRAISAVDIRREAWKTTLTAWHETMGTIQLLRNLDHICMTDTAFAELKREYKILSDDEAIVCQNESELKHCYEKSMGRIIRHTTYLLLIEAGEVATEEWYADMKAALTRTGVALPNLEHEQTSDDSPKDDDAKMDALLGIMERQSEAPAAFEKRLVEIFELCGDMAVMEGAMEYLGLRSNL